jgi:hypothetical protein
MRRRFASMAAAGATKCATRRVLLATGSAVATALPVPRPAHALVITELGAPGAPEGDFGGTGGTGGAVTPAVLVAGQVRVMR